MSFTIWNPNAWDTSGSKSGNYRVYVAVTDENGVVLEDMVAWDEFGLVVG